MKTKDAANKTAAEQKAERLAEEDAAMVEYLVDVNRFYGERRRGGASRAVQMHQARR